ncbi:SMAD/FHA domain-containing protein, partial [Kockiozyma suomiensis]|uniref:SMAD/FHA domain-containing protein n=1 Tax=Kockiozyma suomiensis TaxID=1337062 RepID=UPI0033437004
IRMSTFIDHSTATPALYFEPIERKGREGVTIRLGRYTDKKEIPNAEVPYAPVVFKSKVVSRTHAELWVDNGQWYVKDVKSSSGTFLNRIRLSPACTTSQAFPIKDGDILQLGMDFRGGSEEVYKCVKMRVEINRSWQKRINNFNVSAHSRLRSLTQEKPSAGQQQECSICLVAVAPCQSLFVAPCSHVWHYKCIRPIIVKSYPQFLCPNCRAVCDLEADVDVPE